MSDHLKLVMSGEELNSIRDVAREQGMTVTEWVRETLAKACCHVAVGDGDRKLAAIRAAVEYRFPTADIDQMLSEIEPDSRRDV
jgi:hypothetical protein